MDNATPRRDYEPVIQYMNDCELSIPGLINVLLTDKKYKNHSLTNNLLVNGSEMIISSLLGHASLPEQAWNAVCVAVERVYAREIEELVDEDHGFHFGAGHAAPGDLEDFGLGAMSNTYLKLAPRLWSLLDALLKARKRRTSSLVLPQTLNSGLAEGQGDRDEARLEGSRQRSMSHESYLNEISTYPLFVL
ncbi:hypothetical protein F5887DRAFT_923209 [Amanita rubescens]|nr:hypothetical protein F5887DRAFT_923209 [Amanita rubescens]